MARMRTIKPEAFTSDSLAGVSIAARWTFAGLWTQCDDEGRSKYEPRLLKAALYPLDDEITSDVVERHLRELEAVYSVCFYTVAGKAYVHVPEFHSHQHPNRKVESKLPPCPRTEHGPGGDFGTADSTDAQRTAVAVRERSGLTPVVVVEGRGDVEVWERSQSARASTAIEPTTDTTQAIIGRWIEHCRQRPPERVIGPVSKHVKELLAEGIDPAHVERGLAQWAGKGLNPAALPSVVNEVMNARPSTRAATTDSRAAEALALSERLRASGE